MTNADLASRVPVHNCSTLAEAERLWFIGSAALEIAEALGWTESTVRRYAGRYRWKRSPEGAKRLRERANRLVREGQERGNSTRWGLGWPVMRGDEEHRDRRFVRALIREGIATGAIRVVS